MNEIKFIGYSKKLNKWIYGMPSYNFKYIFNKESDNSPENYEVEPESVKTAPELIRGPALMES